MSLKAKLGVLVILGVAVLASFGMIRLHESDSEREFTALLAKYGNGAWTTMSAEHTPVPVLLHGLQMRLQMYETPAYRALWRSMPRCIRERLRSPVDSDYGDLRGHSAQILGEVRPTTPPIVKALTVALRQPNEFVKASAASALQHIAQRKEIGQCDLDPAIRELQGMIARTSDPDYLRFLTGVLETIAGVSPGYWIIHLHFTNGRD